MLNIDTRLIDAKKITDSEFWLLMHIARRIDETRTCFPSNETLMKDCDWGLEKLQKYKKSLIDKGYLQSIQRKIITKDKGSRLSSNTYKITTNLISIYTNLADLDLNKEQETPPARFSANWDSANGESSTEVLTNSLEVLSIPSEKETYIPFPKADKKEKKGTSSDKGRSNFMRGGADEATKQVFEEFRLYAKKVGMSGARGLETEYEYFKKKHKDYETVIPILLTCLQSEVADREAKKKANQFVPAFKNFLTWVNKRAWETYEKAEEVQETSEPNILQMNPQQIADYIRAKIDSEEWTEEEGKAKYKYYRDNRPKKYG